MTSAENKFRKQRHARIRRVKQLLRWMPRRTNLHRYPFIKWFASTARKRPYLWSFKVKQCTPAFYAGSIISFLPIYGTQLLLALAAAIIFRANLPITAGLQFITNPFTAIPLYYLTYRVGRWVIDFIGYGEGLNRISTNFNSLILGGIIVGTVVGGILDLIYRIAAHEAKKISEHAPGARIEAKSSSSSSNPDSTDSADEIRSSTSE